MDPCNTQLTSTARSEPKPDETYRDCGEPAEWKATVTCAKGHDDSGPMCTTCARQTVMDRFWCAICPAGERTPIVKAVFERET